MPGLAGVAAPQLLGALGAGAIVFGSLLALRQERLKLLVAYSTVAQLGYLFLVFPLALDAEAGRLIDGSALIAGLIQAASHATAKAAMFMAAGMIYVALGHDRIAALGGRRARRAACRARLPAGRRGVDRPADQRRLSRQDPVPPGGRQHASMVVVARARRRRRSDQRLPGHAHRRARWRRPIRRRHPRAASSLASSRRRPWLSSCARCCSACCLGTPGCRCLSPSRRRIRSPWVRSGRWSGRFCWARRSPPCWDAGKNIARCAWRYGWSGPIVACANGPLPDCRFWG